MGVHIIEVSLRRGSTVVILDCLRLDRSYKNVRLEGNYLHHRSFGARLIRAKGINGGRK